MAKPMKEIPEGAIRIRKVSFYEEEVPVASARVMKDREGNYRFIITRTDGAIHWVDLRREGGKYKAIFYPDQRSFSRGEGIVAECRENKQGETICVVRKGSEVHEINVTKLSAYAEELDKLGIIPVKKRPFWSRILTLFRR